MAFRSDEVAELFEEETRAHFDESNWRLVERALRFLRRQRARKERYLERDRAQAKRARRAARARSEQAFPALGSVGCVACRAAFLTRDGYLAHLRRIHSPERPGSGAPTDPPPVHVAPSPGAH